MTAARVCIYVCGPKHFVGVCNLPFGVCILPFGVCNLPFGVCNLPFGMCNQPFGVCNLPFGVCILPFGVCNLPFGVCNLPFGVCNQPFGVFNQKGHLGHALGFASACCSRAVSDAATGSDGAVRCVISCWNTLEEDGDQKCRMP